MIGGALEMATLPVKCIVCYTRWRDADEEVIDTSGNLQELISEIYQIQSQIRNDFKLPNWLISELACCFKTFDKLEISVNLVCTSRDYFRRLFYSHQDVKTLKDLENKLKDLKLNIVGLRGSAIGLGCQLPRAEVRPNDSSLIPNGFTFDLISYNSLTSAAPSCAQGLSCTQFSSGAERMTVIPRSVRIKESSHFLSKALHLKQVLSPSALIKQQVMYFLHKCEQLRCPKASFMLGMFYLQGVYVQRNRERGIYHLETALSLGSVWSIIELFTIYFHGVGVEKNEHQALSYIDKIHRKRYSDGVVKLLFREGTDPNEVMRDFKLTLLLRDRSLTATSKYYIGICYHRNKNYRQAFSVLKRVADDGLYWAIIYVIMAYRFGIGVQKDLAETARYTAEVNKDTSHDNIFSASVANANINKAYCSPYVKCVFDTFLAGFVAEFGIGLRREMPEVAAHYYRISATRADPCVPAAQFLLARLLLHGTGVEKNEVEGLEWLRKAKANGITANVI